LRTTLESPVLPLHFRPMGLNVSKANLPKMQQSQTPSSSGLTTLPSW